MKKKYIVYYQWDQIEAGSKDEYCNHHFLEFDTIQEAVSQFNSLGTSSKWILKLVKWKTTIEDITDSKSQEETDK